MKITNKYDDIIKRSCPKTEKGMPVSDRAAQFLSFAALTGFDDAIDETEQANEKEISKDDKYYLD